MKIWDRSNDSQDLGQQVGTQMAEQGITADSVSWNMVNHIAEENNLDDWSFAIGVQDGLEGNIWCDTCRCTQPPVHTCID